MSCVTKTTGVPALRRFEEAGDDLLIREVEGEERLVGEEERLVGDERLRYPKPLLLTARESSERRIGVAAGADGLDRPLDALVLGCREAGRAPPMTVETEAHEIAAAQGELAVEDALLRDVADPRAHLGGQPAVDRDRAGARLEQAEEDADERRLARPVRAEHGEQLAALEREAQVAPQHAVPEAERQAFDGYDAHRASARSRLRACASCHCWKERRGGIVSAIPTTGMPASRAAARTRVVIGETAWLL